MESIQLPAPPAAGEISLEEALHGRHSIREFEKAALTLDELSRILWASQGINADDGGRTAPSAGALYPIELFVAIGSVEGIEAGVYRYRPIEHVLTPHAEGDLRKQIAGAALRQDWMADSSTILVITAVFRRTTAKYGDRGRRYVHMEAGVVAQSASLMVSATGLGTTVVGAFDDEDVARLLNLPREMEPLLLMPLGRPR